MPKNVKRNVLIIIFLLLVTIIIIVVSVSSNKIKHTKTFAEFKDKLDSQSSQINAWDYFSVEYAMSMPGEKTAVPGGDSINNNEISYYVRLENKTDAPIEVSASLYLADSLRKEFVVSAEPVIGPPLEKVIIEPTRGYSFEVNSALIFEVSNLAPSELKKMKEMASKVFLEVRINGKFDYKMIDLNS